MRQTYAFFSSSLRAWLEYLGHESRKFSLKNRLRPLLRGAWYVPVFFLAYSPSEFSVLVWILVLSSFLLYPSSLVENRPAEAPQKGSLALFLVESTERWGIVSTRGFLLSHSLTTLIWRFLRMNRSCFSSVPLSRWSATIALLCCHSRADFLVELRLRWKVNAFIACATKMTVCWRWFVTTSMSIPFLSSIMPSLEI